MIREGVVKPKRGTIVDVRTQGEFMDGNVPGSINIPLHEIPERLEELKNFEVPLILCCASGNRSGQAHLYLEKKGIESVNGGSWHDGNYLKSLLK